MSEIEGKTNFPFRGHISSAYLLSHHETFILEQQIPFIIIKRKFRDGSDDKHTC